MLAGVRWYIVSIDYCLLAASANNLDIALFGRYNALMVWVWYRAGGVLFLKLQGATN